MQIEEKYKKCENCLNGPSGSTCYCALNCLRYTNEGLKDLWEPVLRDKLLIELIDLLGSINFS